MYSFEQLNIFIAVCETGSFSAAARKLKRAQSGISQSIANLELDIDKTLFDRAGNTPKLTSDGEALLPMARAILYQKNQFDQKIEALQQHHEHEITLAIEESLDLEKLIPALNQFSERYPTVNIHLLTAPTDDVQYLVQHGLAQLGLLYASGNVPDNMDFSLLGYNKFITVVCPDHPLTKINHIDDGILRYHRQLVVKARNGKVLWFANIISSQVWYGSNHMVIKKMAMEGLGWASLPTHMVKEALKSGRLVELNVIFERHGWVTAVDYIVSRTHKRGPALNGLIECIKPYFDDNLYLS